MSILQQRATITRHTVLLRAAEVFNRNGYSQAALQEIVSHSGVTKGALYFHFSSKESLARAVIDEGCARLEAACTRRSSSYSPALETLIGISYLISDPGLDDALILAAFRLLVEVGDYTGTGPVIFVRWTSMFRDLAARAVAEGDFRPSTDPVAAAQLLFGCTLGTRLLATASSSMHDLPRRMTTVWSAVLPALVDESKVEYFSQFAERRLSPTLALVI
ncbi:ScbR family autoregulator-binding transcription factor [Rhodococcus jostii]|uniref:ScbR family autoregulator-binding transcription factor n=1 Tax=Rhodococcus jostii TaxID=132919 RepID=UPI00363CD446